MGEEPSRPGKRSCPSYSCLADACPTKALSILLLPCQHLSYQGLVYPTLALPTLACPTEGLSVLLFTLPTVATLICPTKALSVGQPWHNAQELSLITLFSCSKDHLFRGQQLGCCIHVFFRNLFNFYFISYHQFVYQLHAGPTGVASETTNGHHHLHSRCTTQTVDSRWVVGIS